MTHHTNIIYKIFPKPRLRSVPPFAKLCIYITPPMVLAKAPEEPKRGHGIGIYYMIRMLLKDNQNWSYVCF